MKKRFIVALESATPEQDKAFKEHVRDNGYGWWHWLPNVWLLYTTSDNITAIQLRNAIKEIYPGVSHLVLELSGNDDSWVGYGVDTEGKSMFKWIRENWNKD